MKLVSLIAGLCVFTGCNTYHFVQETMMVRQLSRENARANHIYRDVIGEHAENQTLLGTWTRSPPHELSGHLQPEIELTLSLFKDDGYIQHRVQHSQQNMLFKIYIEEGLWAQQEPGKIELTPHPTDADVQGEVRIIDLSEWTNSFVEVDRQLNASNN